MEAVTTPAKTVGARLWRGLALYADVAVPFPIFQHFTYSVDEQLSDRIAPGIRVVVPFRNRHVVGLVVRVHGEKREGELKPIRNVLDEEPIVSPALLELGNWLASYYLAPPGETLRVMLPPGLMQKKTQPEKKVRPSQRRRPVAGTAAQPSAAVVKHTLNEDQQRIFRKIQSHLGKEEFQSVLLHGVTGSGKTEIYLNAIAAALSRGKTALMLVPEIGLTPQVSRYFRGWFGEQVAVLHSGLSDGERFDQWNRIREEKARVVIGTRSAVFAPLKNLGIIIVDEEQDGSYKQEDLPRYNARDTALKRGQIEGALVVLGSATPQLETYYQSVEKGRHAYERLSSRVLERSLPTVHIVDMRVEFEKMGKAAIISDLLKESIRQRLKRKEQVLILINRRGYSSVLLCRSCGHTERCENCSISLTFHHELHRLCCHYCGYARSVPTRCRECDKEYIYFLGEGTERIQEVLQKLFPHAEVDRMDRDTVQRKGSFERILGAFAEGKTDILIGTQMIAKGHDFPRVTLVGVLAAEQTLRLADFRAAERTFQLLTQVAGRAGRGEQAGDVIIQTYFPNHYSLRHACAQDYRLFYEQEIRFRRNFRYPPFTALANLIIQGKDKARVGRLAERTAEYLTGHRSRCSNETRMRILGPAPAALERLKGEYRFQILIKTTSRSELREVLERTWHTLREAKAPLKNISIDIDPASLL